MTVSLEKSVTAREFTRGDWIFAAVHAGCDLGVALVGLVGLAYALIKAVLPVVVLVVGAVVAVGGLYYVYRAAKDLINDLVGLWQFPPETQV